MPRLGCDTRIKKSSIDIVDRVSDLRNRVTWLKNVEFCLLGDQIDRISQIKVERQQIEFNNGQLRKQLATPLNKEKLNDQQYRIIDEYNRLVFIHQSLIDRLEACRTATHQPATRNPLASAATNRQSRKTKHLTRRIGELQERLTSVKLINKTLDHCKRYLQCDLDLLRKELPNVQKDIGLKVDQRSILRKEFLEIVAENKRRLKAYQQLLDQTETQTRQRRIIHEQAMASVAEQIEDQYQVQMIAVNEMANSLESRRLTTNAMPTSISSGKTQTLMTSDEIVQVRCMYDQFYNIVTAGFPIDIANSEQLKKLVDEVSSKTTTLVALTKRLMEEKQQLNQQRNRTEKLRELIDMSMNFKNETRYQILDRMIDQRDYFQLFYTNDTVEVQNRILRQINDFLLVLSKALCEHDDQQSLVEPSMDFLERLQFICDLLSKAIKTVVIEPLDDEERQFSPILRRSGGANDESSHFTSKHSQSRLIDRSINSSLSSISSRPRRNSLKTNVY